MKKIASILLAVLVVFSMFSFVVSAAAPTLTATANKTSVKVGDKVTVTVSLSKDSGLGTLMFDINYNKDVFKVDSANVSSLFAIAEKNENVAGKVSYGGMASGSVTEAGTVCTVTFEAIKAGDANFTLKVTEATDDAYAAVNVTASSAIKVSVAADPVTPPPADDPVTPPADDPVTPPADDPVTPPAECKHEYSNYLETKKATCVEKGLKEATCKLCGDTISEIIPATGKHIAGAWEVTKKATATAEGEKVQKCKDCGKVMQTAKIAKLSSNPLTDPAIPNTDAIA